MRITQNMLNNNMLRNLNSSLARMERLQEMLASGKKISKPSHDPVVATRGMFYRTSMVENEQFRSNSDRAMNELQTVETAVAEGKDVLMRIKELIIQASNDTLSPGDRQKIRDEVMQLRDHLGSVANTTHGGVYLFSGTDTDTPPYGELPKELQQQYKKKDGTVPEAIDPSKLPYASTKGYVNTNRDEIVRELSQQIYIPVNVDGVNLFGQQRVEELRNKNIPDMPPIIPQDSTIPLPVPSVSSTALPVAMPNAPATPSSVLAAGQEIAITFNTELDSSGVSAVRDAFAASLGIPSASVTVNTTDNQTFKVSFSSPVNLAGGKKVEFSAGTAKNQNGVANSETISFAIPDPMRPTLNQVTLPQNKDQHLSSGETVTITFDRTITNADDAKKVIQQAVDHEFGAGKAIVEPVTAGGASQSFTIKVLPGQSVDLKDGKQITIPAGTLTADGSFGNEAITFTIADPKDTDEAFQAELSKISQQYDPWETDVFRTLDNIINDLQPSPYMTDKYGRLLAADATTGEPLFDWRTTMVNGQPVNYKVYKLYDPDNPAQKPLLKPQELAKPKNGKELTGYVTVIENHIDNFLQVQSSIGARVNRVEMIQNRLDEQHNMIEQSMSDEEDADLAQVIMELQNNENVHRAALAAGSRIIQPSLLDFLR
jgi:flagellin-like hook-associated protein FlgL